MLEGVLASVLNRFLASYVDGLNTSQLNVGIWSGDVKLKNLRLKTSALDKFRLPIDVKEGYLGDLTLSIPWSNLKGKPVRVLVENVYLLAAPKNASVQVDEDEEEERAQAAKQEKLANAELLGRDGPQEIAMSTEDAQKNESFTSSLVTKIIDNLQITVRNIHIRYEDDLSNPEHPFSAGLTLAEFSAVSTDGNWNPTFIQNSSEGIHKLARLESLAVYWDTDATSLAGYPIDEAQEKFKSLIAREGQIPSHQFILSPVSGAGRLVMRHKMTPDVAKMDAELLFDQLGFALDDEQYRDVISVADLFHFYTRQAQYRKFRPKVEELEENHPRAMLQFAGRAILSEVHEKHKVWTWDFFKQRRDDRKQYVTLFKDKEQQSQKQNQSQAGIQATQSEAGTSLRELEQRLHYKDIRFYRSIARNELRKERLKKKKEDLENHSILGGDSHQPKQGGGWLGWIWGGGSQQGQGNTDGGMLNDEQKKELYDAIEWDEEAGSKELTQTVDLPEDALKLRLTTKLQTGSFALRDHSKGNDIISLVFDSLQADVLQRIDNFQASVSLGGLRVYDGTLPNSLYPQIVRVKDDELDIIQQQSWSGTLEQAEKEVQKESDPENPFFSLQFESKPLDKRADNALTLRMRSLEIVYHRTYVESIVRFFKPPESELELIGALIDVASETIEGIRKETRAGLETALDNHKTIDIDLDIKAPIIIIPEDASKRNCQHIVLDAGQISLRSVLADQSAVDTVRSKQSKQYTQEDYRQLEDLMYDRFFVKLESMQLVMGPNLEHCLKSLNSSVDLDQSLHFLERINLDFTLHNSILPKAPNLTKFKLTGHLPLLRVNFSDRKYKTLMAIVDAAIPHLDDDDAKSTSPMSSIKENKPASDAAAAAAKRDNEGEKGTSAANTSGLNLSKERRSRIASQMRGDEYVVDSTTFDDDEDETADFKDAEDDTTDRINAHQKNFEMNFVVDSLQGSIFKSNTDPRKPDRLLVEAKFEGFLLNLAIFPYHMEVEVGLRSLELEDKIVDQKQDLFRSMITSKVVDDGVVKNIPSRSTASSPDKTNKDLVRVKYTQVDTDSPEFMTVYEGIDQSINVEVSTINIMLTRVSILAVYDWIMTTFVPEDPISPTSQKQIDTIKTENPSAEILASTSERKEKLRVRVKLTSIVMRLNNDGQLLSTLTLSTADVAVLLRGNTMRVAARLGSLLLLDNTLRETATPEFKKLLTIDGDEVADFTYETFDSADEATYPGYDMSIWLRAGSLRFTFMEESIAELLQFFSKFAQMKAVYDVATQAASAQATQLQAEVMKIHYDVIIKTPIVVLPRDVSSSDVITVNLGEIYAHNTFHNDEKKKHIITKVEAGVRHIRLASRLNIKKKEHHIQMIDDVNISVDITQQEHVDHEPGKDSTEPDMQILAKMSDVNIKMTEQQYAFIMKLTQSIPKAFAYDDGEGMDEESGLYDGDSLASSRKQVTAAADQAVKPEGVVDKKSGVDMLPELGTRTVGKDGQPAPLSTSMDLLFNVQTINIELFTSAAIEQDSMHQASLATFALNGTEVKVKMLSDSSLEAEVTVKSFNVADTRSTKETKFREIIPAVKHDGYQFMLSYTMAGGDEGSALALVTIDSPKIIFSLDPLFGLVNFFMSAFEEEPASATIPADVASRKRIESTKTGATAARQSQASKGKPADAAAGGELAFRINVVDPTIILLAAPERNDTLAIVLSIRQILMSQQGILALKVDQFGMFMCGMDRPKDTLRLIDNFDIALSLDCRAGSESMGRVNTSIEINVDPIVLRVSIRDLLVISEVVNKAIEMSNKKPAADERLRQPSGGGAASTTGGGIQSIRSDSDSEVGTKTTATRQSSQSAPRLETAELVIAKEKLKADFQGFQLILIGDVHSLPMFDCNISGFNVDIRDWSADMRAVTSIDMYLNYYNLSRSHWEPLIDPWNVEFLMESKSGSNQVLISSKKRLELNITTTLIETALTSAAMIEKETKSGVINDIQRGHQAPFKIRNRTGYRISLWSQQEDGKVARHGAQHLDDGQDMPWRFGDWKLMREHIIESSGVNELSVHLEGTTWERIKHLSVDQEGEKVINLRPKMDKVTHRMLCEVKLENNVKVITLRSTFNIENNTLVPIEFVLLDADRKLTDRIHKIAPGQSCPVPIEAAYHNQIRLRPDPGFEYGWSNESVGWQDLIKKSTRVMNCNDGNDDEAPFRFQCFTVYDRQDPNARTYPRLTLRIRAPVEVENLLPYDIQYRIFDKNHNRNWSSFLRKGGISPIHVVDLSHLLLLSIDIQSSVFSPSEFAIIATDNGDDFPVEKFLTLADSENLKLQLRLHYHKYPDSGGAFKVQIYSPYIFVNLTGLPFSLKTKSWIGGAKVVAGQDLGSKKATSDIRKEPQPFLFSHPSKDRRNRVQLRVGDSNWSRPTSFEAIGSATEVVIPSLSKNEEIHLGLTIEEGLGKFQLSKVVKLTPRYLIRNNLGVEMNLREVSAADFITAQPGKRQALHSLRVGAGKQICLAYPGLNNKWTAPFNLEDIGRVYLRIAKVGHQQHLIKVEVVLEGPTIFINLGEEAGTWPFMLRNESDYTITFMQAIEKSEGAKSDGGTDEAVGKRYELKPKSKMKYAWDYPAMSDKIIKLVANGRERNVNILEIGSLLPFNFPSGDGRGNRVVALDVRADGPTQTLVLSNWTEANSNYKLKRANSTFSRTDSMRTDAGFEAIDVDTKIISSFNIELEGVGISLINRSVQELAYISFRGLEFHYSESEVTTAYNLICKWIQIDNQLFTCLFPIVLYPAVIAPNQKDLESHPTLQASLIQSKDSTHGVTHIKYASFLLQEVTIELDEDFLFACLDFAKLKGLQKESDSRIVDFAEYTTSIPEPEDDSSNGSSNGGSNETSDVYIGILHLQPLAINLSIVRTERSGEEETSTSGNPLFFLLNAASMAVGSVADAPIRLSALVIENVRLTPELLIERVTMHYTQSMLYQLYRLVGSIDVLGNPVSLFNTVSGGVSALFYEPYQGLVMHGNHRELGLGLARGASTAVKSIVFGLTDSASKVTGSISQGLASATMDREFQARRRMTKFRNKPRHALLGLSAAGQSFFTSVTSGVEGLALRPLEGAEENGAAGFVAGIGRALVGLATKPAVGFFDAASNITEGVRNTTGLFEKNEIDRVRLPRFIASDGIVRPHSDREALGQTWLKNVDDGRLMKDHYVAHVDVGNIHHHHRIQQARNNEGGEGEYQRAGTAQGDNVVLLTISRILFIRTVKMKVAWEVLLSDLSSISLESEGIALILRGNIAGPFLPLRDVGSRNWLFKQISRVVQSYNAAHQQ
ncbi:hypothetical protein CBS101457_002827 [Exobasidium rhododendri]|nr:hypothetical protein CBS101457_002827 [Exobasidium rhododendri]